MEAAAASRSGRLTELEELGWRRPVDEHWLRVRGRQWTAWTAGAVLTFGAPAVALPMLEPALVAVAALCVVHGWAICELQAGRGTAALRRGETVPLGAGGAEGRALGLLGDLVGHEARTLLGSTGLALERGRLGMWLVGDGGALLVRPGGRRVDGWCVAVKEAEGLPWGDRVAHLLLALREDEEGFATVANHGFSGAAWRVRRRLPPEMRPALGAARQAARA